LSEALGESIATAGGVSPDSILIVSVWLAPRESVTCRLTSCDPSA
jgi:hypothetical protein